MFSECCYSMNVTILDGPVGCRVAVCQRVSHVSQPMLGHAHSLCAASQPSCIAKLELYVTLRLSNALVPRSAVVTKLPDRARGADWLAGTTREMFQLRGQVPAAACVTYLEMMATGRT
jgi:hypothetical protein